jgi:general secretion pathway protein I
MRRGFSLLEILLALAILGGALAVLSQIVGTGGQSSRSARELAMARMLCQSKLAELLVTGMTPVAVASTPLVSPDSQSDTVFNYAVEVAPAPLQGMLAIRVSVQAEGETDGPAVATYSITRWIIDPALGLQQTAAEPAGTAGGAAGAGSFGAGAAGGGVVP